MAVGSEKKLGSRRTVKNKNILAKILIVFFVFRLSSLEASDEKKDPEYKYTHEERKNLPGAVTVFLVPFGERHLSNGEPASYLLLFRSENFESLSLEQNYYAYSPQPNIQGNVRLPLTVFENLGNALGFRILNLHSFYDSQFYSHGSRLILPHPSRFLEALSSFSRSDRFQLVPGENLVSPLLYLGIVARGALPLSLPQENDSSQQFLNMIHDYSNHVPLQVFLPARLLNFVAARTRLFLELRTLLLNSLEPETEEHNRKLISTLTLIAVKAFDTTHGNLNNALDRTFRLRFVVSFVVGYNQAGIRSNQDLATVFPIYMWRLLNSQIITDQNFRTWVFGAIPQVLENTNVDLSLSYDSSNFENDFESERMHMARLHNIQQMRQYFASNGREFISMIVFFFIFAFESHLLQ